MHLSAAEYFDVLVTDDVEFRETITLIPSLPLQVMSPDEFCAFLRTPAHERNCE
ncbi:MAG: hypothetical protein ACXWWO_06535 [Candidatus Limnocylindria bacterium]